MKTKKKISSLIMLLIFSVIFATVIDAQSRYRPRQQQRQQQQYQQQDHNRHQQRRMKQVSPGPSTGAVGAPLDGGLLALLAGAGITYFAARKKKKNAQE